jgi:hypothetical protein
MPLRLKDDAITDPELEHARVGTHLIQEPQAGDDSVVEVDEFRLGELVDVDRHSPPVTRIIARAILTTQVGSIARPEGIREPLRARPNGRRPVPHRGGP